MEYVPRGCAFERPRIYCTSMYVHVRHDQGDTFIHMCIIALARGPLRMRIPSTMVMAPEVHRIDNTVPEQSGK